MENKRIRKKERKRVEPHQQSIGEMSGQENEHDPDLDLTQDVHYQKRILQFQRVMGNSGTIRQLNRSSTLHRSLIQRGSGSGSDSESDEEDTDFVGFKAQKKKEKEDKYTDRGHQHHEKREEQFLIELDENELFTDLTEILYDKPDQRFFYGTLDILLRLRALHSPDQLNQLFAAYVKSNPPGIQKYIKKSSRFQQLTQDPDNYTLEQLLTQSFAKTHEEASEIILRVFKSGELSKPDELLIALGLPTKGVSRWAPGDINYIMQILDEDLSEDELKEVLADERFQKAFKKKDTHGAISAHNYLSVLVAENSEEEPANPRARARLEIKKFFAKIELIMKGKMGNKKKARQRVFNYVTQWLREASKEARELIEDDRYAIDWAVMPLDLHDAEYILYLIRNQGDVSKYPEYAEVMNVDWESIDDEEEAIEKEKESGKELPVSSKTRLDEIEKLKELYQEFLDISMTDAMLERIHVKTTFGSGKHRETVLKSHIRKMSPEHKEKILIRLIGGEAGLEKLLKEGKKEEQIRARMLTMLDGKLREVGINNDADIHEIMVYFTMPEVGENVVALMRTIYNRSHNSHFLDYFKTKGKTTHEMVDILSQFSPEEFDQLEDDRLPIPVKLEIKAFLTGKKEYQDRIKTMTEPLAEGIAPARYKVDFWVTALINVFKTSPNSTTTKRNMFFRIHEASVEAQELADQLEYEVQNTPPQQDEKAAKELKAKQDAINELRRLSLNDVVKQAMKEYDLIIGVRVDEEFILIDSSNVDEHAKIIDDPNKFTLLSETNKSTEVKEMLDNLPDDVILNEFSNFAAFRKILEALAAKQAELRELYVKQKKGEQIFDERRGLSVEIDELLNQLEGLILEVDEYSYGKLDKKFGAMLSKKNMQVAQLDQAFREHIASALLNNGEARKLLVLAGLPDDYLHYKINEMLGVGVTNRQGKEKGGVKWQSYSTSYVLSKLKATQLAVKHRQLRSTFGKGAGPFELNPEDREGYNGAFGAELGKEDKLLQEHGVNYERLHYIRERYQRRIKMAATILTAAAITAATGGVGAAAAAPAAAALYGFLIMGVGGATSKAITELVDFSLQGGIERTNKETAVAFAQEIVKLGLSPVLGMLGDAARAGEVLTALNSGTAIHQGVGTALVVTMNKAVTEFATSSVSQLLGDKNNAIKRMLDPKQVQQELKDQFAMYMHGAVLSLLTTASTADLKTAMGSGFNDTAPKGTDVSPEKMIDTTGPEGSVSGSAGLTRLITATVTELEGRKAIPLLQSKIGVAYDPTALATGTVKLTAEQKIELIGHWINLGKNKVEKFQSDLADKKEEPSKEHQQALKQFEDKRQEISGALKAAGSISDEKELDAILTTLLAQAESITREIMVIDGKGKLPDAKELLAEIHKPDSPFMKSLEFESRVSQVNQNVKDIYEDLEAFAGMKKRDDKNEDHMRKGLAVDRNYLASAHEMLTRMLQQRTMFKPEEIEAQIALVENLIQRLYRSMSALDPKHEFKTTLDKDTFKKKGVASESLSGHLAENDGRKQVARKRAQAGLQDSKSFISQAGNLIKKVDELIPEDKKPTGKELHLHFLRGNLETHKEKLDGLNAELEVMLATHDTKDEVILAKLGEIAKLMSQTRGLLDGLRKDTDVHKIFGNAQNVAVGTQSQFDIIGASSACTAMAYRAVQGFLSGGVVDQNAIDQWLVEGEQIYTNTVTHIIAQNGGNGAKNFLLSMNYNMYLHANDLVENPNSNADPVTTFTWKSSTLAQKVSGYFTLRRGTTKGILLTVGGFSFAVAMNGNTYSMFDSHGYLTGQGFAAQYNDINEFEQSLARFVSRLVGIRDQDVAATVYRPKPVAVNS